MPDKKNKGKKPIFVYVSEELHKTLTELASEKEGGTLSSLRGICTSARARRQ